jgi:prepilin-type processing-associated H-X9-DG protein
MSDSSPNAVTDKPIQFSLFSVLLITALVAVCLGAFMNWGVASGLIVSFIVVASATSVWLAKDKYSAVSILGIILVLSGPFLFDILRKLSRPRDFGNHTVQCQLNMSNMAKALQLYHRDYGSFPPAFTVDENDNRLHSWRTLLLPYLDGKNIYANIRFDEPWDSRHNRQFNTAVIPIFMCGRVPYERSGTITPYVAVFSPNGVFRGPDTIGIAEITDPTSETILFVEWAESDIHWMEPRDLPEELLANGINPEQANGISSYHGGGANAAFADGHVEFLTQDQAEEELRSLITIAGGD